MLDGQLNQELGDFDGMMAAQRAAAKAAGAGTGAGDGDAGTLGSAGNGADGEEADDNAPPPLVSGRGTAPGSTSRQASGPGAGGLGGNSNGGGMPDIPGQRRQGEYQNVAVAAPVPADIPTGNDDDVVARQLREAAMHEPDPVLREKLWNEYRKYKGLPLKK